MSRSQSFHSKYRETGERYEAGPREYLYVGPRLSIGTVRFDLVDPERPKIEVILFDVKYVKNGNSYNVRSMGFTLDYLERLKVKVTILWFEEIY